MKYIIIAMLFLSHQVLAQTTQHSSYRVAVTQLIKTECGIDIGLVQSNFFASGDGVVSGEVTTVICPAPKTAVVKFKPPTTNQDCSPLDPVPIRYEIEFVGGVVTRLRACSEVTGLCSAWVTPDEAHDNGC